MNISHNVAAVVIGRNEGERLRTCLKSVLGAARHVVYVDSGSSDQSVDLALNLGCLVAQLDMRIPFTAARARNEGFKILQHQYPDTTYVQFIDGDCILDNAWIFTASDYLATHPGIAAICGRLHERFPERSIYNKLCDLEWDRPPGNARACGGIVLIRADAFTRVGGFRADIIAGEEPEFCVRLRAAGWQIWRLAADMAWHDAAMTRFSQWWLRTKRAGYAYALGTSLHGAPPERHFVRETRRSLAWGVYLPLIILASSAWNPWMIVTTLAYPLQILRLRIMSSYTGNIAWLHAMFTVLGRFPEGFGVLGFYSDKFRGRLRGIIEYK